MEQNNMAVHIRHVLSTPGEIRAQLKFMRSDLLWQHGGPLRSPYADEILDRARRDKRPLSSVCVEVDELPMVGSTGALVGPTILDMLVRGVRTLDELPATMKKRITDDAHAAGKIPDKVYRVWMKRDPKTLWPKPNQVAAAWQKADQKQADDDDDDDDDEGKKRREHPFIKGLASGGTAIGEQDGWSVVTKLSTVSIGEYVAKLAVGIHGSIGGAYTAIGKQAADAWEVDLARAQKIWDVVAASPEGVVIEDDYLSDLRPSSSISQAVERDVMREVCKALGVDPDMNIKRGPGQPPGSKSSDGVVVSVTVVDGAAVGVFIADYMGIAAGTEFADLDIVKLAEVLGELLADKHKADAAMLEAYLDSADENWRDRVADAQNGVIEPGAVETPYDTLGVRPDTPMDKIAAIYMQMRQIYQAHNLGNDAAVIRLTNAFKAIRREREKERKV